MKIFSLLILIFLSFGSYYIVAAQADCAFDFRLYVRDSKGNSLKNARIKMNVADFYYNPQKDVYSAWSLLGINSKYNVTLKVNADGFNRFESDLELKCGNFSYDLRLKQKGTNETSVFEELAVIWGKVKDANDGAIPNTKVILIDEKGNKVETITNEWGYFSFDARDGKYMLEVAETSGFKAKKIENLVLPKGYKYFEVKLDVKSCDDPTINCDSVTSDPIRNN